MNIYERSSYFVFIILAAFAVWKIPTFAYVLLFLLICGLIEILRNRPLTLEIFIHYFWEKGVLNLLLAPLNLFLDVLSLKNHKIYAVEDYTESHQEEIQKVLELFDIHKDKIREYMDPNVEVDGRSLLFLKWYGQDENFIIPDFNKEFKYIQTIAISAFKKSKGLSWHLGPLRTNFRVLYNFYPGPDSFLEVQGKKHYWSDNPYFSFDDTLYHRSVNDSDQTRYCAFIDIQRPTHFPGILRFVNKLVHIIILKIRPVFYTRWKIRQ